ncbi:MAG TPA: hypothetical protein PL035_00630 [Bacillota bacterium]|nr:hypothetical protein [Bacillota bacterium]HQC35572.1 hypothetical protein [Bacillota bacterium]
MMKRISRSIWISMLLVLLVFVMPVFSESPFMTGFLEEEAFTSGELENLVWTEEGLTLAPGAEEGVFISQELDVQAFERMVMSWNAFMPRGTSVEIEARLFNETAKAWSDWLSWGVWQRSPERHSFSAGDEIGEIEYDIARPKGEGARATKIQIRATLKGEGICLRRIIYTLQDSAIPEREVSAEHEGFSELPEIGYSQFLRVSEIANSMCSAVTVCTQLAMSGEEFLPEEIALHQYDSYLGYPGNWSYSASTAGDMGYKAYVTYADEEELLRLLDEGRSLGMSVKYSNVKGSPYYIEGAPLTTGGHLIAIRGYEMVDGQRYYLVSDSAASNDRSTLLRYKAEELINAWTTRILYVVEGKETQKQSIERIEVSFVPADKEGEYVLQDVPYSIEKDFRNNALKKAGGGYIAYTLEGDPLTYYWVQMTDVNQFYFVGTVKPEDATVYFMSNEGVTLIAKMAESEATEAPAADTEEPEASAPAGEAPEPSAPAEGTPAPSSGSRAMTIAIIAVPVVIVLIIFISGRKKQ